MVTSSKVAPFTKPEKNRGIATTGQEKGLRKRKFATKRQLLPFCEPFAHE